MTVYRVHFKRDGGESHGYEFFLTKQKAKGVIRNTPDTDPQPQEFEIEMTKAGVLAALNQLASHPDNG